VKYKVHWLIDGVIDIESDKIEIAEQTIKDKIEIFIKENSKFFDEMGAKAVQGQAYLPGKDE
jgi:hypothetical protein